jgi:hypothetical protein
MPSPKSTSSPTNNPSANDWDNEDESMDVEPDFEDEAYDISQPDDGSMSINPTILDHTYAHGRRYHKFLEGAYNFPNDLSEQEREEMKHAMVVNTCEGKLHFAPIGKYPQNIVDLGTGTGIWCMESTFPNNLSW